MENKFHTYLKKTGDGISLSQAERTRMRGVVRAYMDMKPVRGAEPAVRIQAWDMRWFFSARPLASALVLALFVSSAGVSYAAVGALPGDALYAIKVHVNEPVVGALALSGPAKTAWAMEVAGERVKEAATLAAEGRLSTTTQEKLRESFEAYSSVAIAHISEEADSSPDGGAQSAVRFEARLSEYEHVLAQIGGAEDAEQDTFASAVRTQHDRVAEIRTRADAESARASSEGVAIAASRMRDAAKRQLDDSLNLARTAAPALSPSSAEVIARELEGAGTRIADGDNLLGKHSAPEALSVFQGALSTTEKLGVFLRTSSAIHSRTGRLVAEPERKGSSASSGNSKRGEGTGAATAESGQDSVRALSVQPAVQPAALSASPATGTVRSGTSSESGRRESSHDSDSKGESDTDRHDDGDEDSLIHISAPSSLLP